MIFCVGENMRNFNVFAVAAMAAAMSATCAHAGPKEACDYSASLEGVSCLVMVDGQIVAETYPGAGDVNKAWRLASGTKSFSGVAAAAAVQDKLLTLDEKVSDTLTEWQGDGRKAITIRQLLSLTSGIDTPAPFRGGRVSPAESVALKLVHPPGTKYAYGQAPFQIFAELMGRKLKGETYEAYLNRRILRPLGVTLEFKPLTMFGDKGPDWGGGGVMSARDWAKFGEFVRQGGRWNGQQLADPAALAENFRGSSVHGGYGLTWWLKAPKGAAVPLEGTTENATDFYKGGADALPVSQVWMAAGAGKQRLYILPERNMVAARQTSRLLMGERSGYSDVEFLRLLLLP
jgi:CubicO group peptidase (beta-lactamase class C family)